MTGIHGWTQLDFCAFIACGNIIESGVNFSLSKLYKNNKGSDRDKLLRCPRNYSRSLTLYRLERTSLDTVLNVLSPVPSDLCATLCEKIVIRGLVIHCTVYSEVQVFMSVILFYLKLTPVRTI
jgi:hypothetical protein